MKDNQEVKDLLREFLDHVESNYYYPRDEIISKFLNYEV